MGPTFYNEVKTEEGKKESNPLHELETKNVAMSTLTSSPP